MEIETQTQLSFEGVHILQVNFTFYKHTNLDAPIDLDIDPKFIRSGEVVSRFGIIMKAELKRKDNFQLQITAVGNFKISNNVDKDSESAFIRTNAPAIMFPYLRAFITNFTSSLGNTVGTIVIPPQFFKGDLDTLEDESR